MVVALYYVSATLEYSFNSSFSSKFSFSPCFTKSGSTTGGADAVGAEYWKY